MTYMLTSEQKTNENLSRLYLLFTILPRLIIFDVLIGTAIEDIVLYTISRSLTVVYMLNQSQWLWVPLILMMVL